MSDGAVYETLTRERQVEARKWCRELPEEICNPRSVAELQRQLSLAVTAFQEEELKCASLRSDAESTERKHREALDDATAPCHGLGCGGCEDCVELAEDALASEREAEVVEDMLHQADQDAGRALAAEIVEASGRRQKNMEDGSVLITRSVELIAATPKKDPGGAP